MSAAVIVQALGGRWHGNYGMARCICHDDGTTPALKISDDPRKSDGIDLHCFAGCNWRDIKAELVRLGLLSKLFPDAPQSDHITNTKQRAAALEHPNRAGAIEMWRQAVPATGTLAEVYLRSRGIDVIPPSLRFVPAAKHGPTGLYFPCLLAGITVAPTRHVVAVHRTFLLPDGRGKACVSESRMMLGPCAGGAVRLGAHGGELAIGEGVETCLSFMQATGTATWAALSTSGLRTVVAPRGVLSIIVLADADPPGEDAAQSLAARLVRQGFSVRIARPPAGHKDFNDLLLAGAA